jgi:serine/threonine protein kinase
LHDKHTELLELAARVADGDAPKWPSPLDEAYARVVDELRIVDTIARLHRERLAPLISADGAEDGIEDAPEIPEVWGHLRIVDRLGAGGFGEVFRAWDTNLQRDVALKLLRPRAGGATRSESVLHEGQRLARVSHPNIVSVYGAQQLGGRVGIWGELLNGRTLAQIVESDGPLSAKEACVVGDAICRALSAAHRQGVLHRDVKAQNVMREKGGRIVLMDFGLGLDVDGAAQPARLAGTPLYLAPELLDGGRPSVRSDSYSLGVLLFYLVTGTMPVTGRSLDEIAARHRRGERQRLPDLRGDLPASFVRVVERALAVDPANRFASCGEMQAALAIAADGVVPGPVRPPAGRRTAALLAAAVIVTAAITAAVAMRTRASAIDPPPVAAEIEPPSGTRFSETSRNVAVVSPDGRHVACVATGNGESRLWVRSLASREVRSLPDTIGASNPFWSPDSATLAFFSGKGLRSISLDGIRSETLAPVTEERGGTWSREGVILFARGPRGGLFTVTAAGGTPKPLLTPDAARDELGFQWPQFLPDGRRFVFFVWSNDARVRGIYLGRLGSTERTRLIGSDMSGIVADGHLLFVRDGTLAVNSLDMTRGRVVGPAQSLISNVAATPFFRSPVTASDTGVLVYTPSQAGDVTALTWFDLSGKPLQTIDASGRFMNPAVSTDGRYLAVQQYHDSLSELRVFDLVRGGNFHVPHPSDAEFPVWSPDGRLTFAATDRGWLDLFVTRVDGDSHAQKLLQSDADKMPTDWSPDGRYLSYTSLSAGGDYDLYVLPVSPGGSPIAISNEAILEEADGHFSIDGRQLAYITNATGRPEVYVRQFPSGAIVRKVSTGGGLSPAWSGGGMLYFLDLAGRIMKVRVPEDERAGIPSPEVVIQTDVITVGTARNHFALAPGATRLLVNGPAAGERSTSIAVLANWPSLVQKP